LKKKILHISYSDISGGAAINCYRIHKALKKSNKFDSQLLVINKRSKDRDTIVLKGFLFNIIHILKIKFIFNLLKIISLMCSESFNTSRSLNIFSSPSILKKIKDINPDLVHLHWINNEMISLKDIASIKQPLVWTLSDLWPFSGVDHYQYKYLKKNKFLTLINKYFLRKKNFYFRNINKIVCISNWQKNLCIASTVFDQSKIETIPCLINVKEWNKIKVKKKGIHKKNHSKYNLLFINSMSSKDPRKGLHFLLQSLSNIKNKSNFKLVVIGDAEEESLKKIGIEYKIINKNFLGDIKKISTFYLLADVLLMPSLEEAFGQTALEASCIGLPVVGFQKTGLSDIIKHKKNGYLARYLNSKDFLEGVTWALLKNKKQNKKLYQNRLYNDFSSNVVVKKYEYTYEQILKNED